MFDPNSASEMESELCYEFMHDINTLVVVEALISQLHNEIAWKQHQDSGDSSEEFIAAPVDIPKAIEAYGSLTDYYSGKLGVQEMRDLLAAMVQTQVQLLDIHTLDSEAINRIRTEETANLLVGDLGYFRQACTNPEEASPPERPALPPRVERLPRERKRSPRRSGSGSGRSDINYY